MEELEALEGMKLGSKKAPLLVSVRSGAAVSMPGMMDTVINVGLSRQLASEWSEQAPEKSWTIWDCYRRYVQSYAMSRGVARDSFDGIIERFKQERGIDFKQDFSAKDMEEIALEYEEQAKREGAKIPKEPLEQVMAAIFSVLGSWESETARSYRKQMQLSEDWGTAVIVQRMVFGNLSKDSGTGALFTTSPQSATMEVELHGDFKICSQGEDVVSGLVNPYPISERQRKRSRPQEDISLEKLYPAIYQRLHSLASMLVKEKAFEHQEMEFTFEGSSREQLFVLQSRPMAGGVTKAPKRFESSAQAEAKALGYGIGVSGAALSGKVVFNRHDIEQERSLGPAPLILLRPDTVP